MCGCARVRVHVCACACVCVCVRERDGKDRATFGMAVTSTCFVVVETGMLLLDTVLITLRFTWINPRLA